MNASTVRQLESSVQEWMDGNPPRPRERRRQYARRAFDAVRPELAASNKAGFDWTIFLPIILRIIEMIIERRRAS